MTHLFEDARSLDWQGMNNRQRSEQYRDWLIDPRIGGVLARFMPTESARLWIKDGPMKEYSRALNGQSKYSPLVPGGVIEPEDIVRTSLGPSWKVVSDSLKVKPLRISVLGPTGDRLTVAWGPVRDLKHLIWAAISSMASGDETDWVICLVTSFVTPVPRNEQNQIDRIASTCGVRVIYYSSDRK